MEFAWVPDSLVESGLEADEWVRAALESCGGRGGGMPGNAQRQAQECNNVSAVVNAANDFADLKVEANFALHAERNLEKYVPPTCSVADD